jgi:hypothetical protein
VSFGKKPVPGGDTKVCLKFDRICAGGEEGFFRDGEESSSECALSCGDGGAEVGWSITPTPSLLAEPSRPIAMGIVWMWYGVPDCLSLRFRIRSNDVPLANSPQLHVIVTNMRSGVKGQTKEA